MGWKELCLNSIHVETQVKELFGFALKNVKRKRRFVISCTTTVAAPRLVEEPAVNQEAGCNVGGS
jgi:hypothetical protein